MQIKTNGQSHTHTQNCHCHCSNMDKVAVNRRRYKNSPLHTLGQCVVCWQKRLTDRQRNPFPRLEDSLAHFERSSKSLAQG